MGRKSHQRVLALWMNGSRVAYWTISPNGHDQLGYDEEWLQSERQRALSLSLPLQTGVIRNAAVGAYFDNLLPDSDPIRKRLQARFGTATRGAFDLLEAIGQDCVGAVQLMPLSCDQAITGKGSYAPDRGQGGAGATRHDPAQWRNPPGGASEFSYLDCGCAGKDRADLD